MGKVLQFRKPEQVCDLTQEYDRVYGSMQSPSSESSDERMDRIKSNLEKIKRLMAELKRSQGIVSEVQMRLVVNNPPKGSDIYSRAKLKSFSIDGVDLTAEKVERFGERLYTIKWKDHNYSVLASGVLYPGRCDDKTMLRQMYVEGLHKKDIFLRRHDWRFGERIKIPIEEQERS